MKNLLEKLQPIFKLEEGVFYPNPKEKETDFIIILDEIEEDPSTINLSFKGKKGVFGYYAYHKLTGDSYPCKTKIFKKIGKPGMYIVVDSFDENKPVDYDKNITLALSKAHDYLLNQLLGEVLNPNLSDAYLSVLDTTKIGLDKFYNFQKLNNHKANLSAEENIKPYDWMDTHGEEEN